MRLYALLLAGMLALGGIGDLAAAPVVVSKTVTDNPKIELTGLESDPLLKADVRRFLGICGWFELAQGGGDAAYTLHAVKQGGTLRMQLAMGGAPVGSWSINCAGRSTRSVAKTAVDAVIETTFKDLKVKGFCHSKIAFCADTASGVRNVFICDIDGGEIEQITNSRTLCVEPAWRPDAKSICYSRYGKSSIDIAETTVGKPRRSRIISAYKGINAGAAISPDCRKMAMILSPDHQVDLYVQDLAGRRLTRLTRGIAVEASPCWSPDGRQLAFVCDESGSPRIYIVGASGGGRRRIPTIGSDAVTPDWSGDNKIVYASRVNGSYTLGVCDLNANTNKRVLEQPGKWESPTWAADNRQVVCKRSDGKGALYVVDTWTGKTRLLVATPHALSMPAWSPCAPKK